MKRKVFTTFTVALIVVVMAWRYRSRSSGGTAVTIEPTLAQLLGTYNLHESPAELGLHTRSTVQLKLDGDRTICILNNVPFLGEWPNKEPEIVNTEDTWRISTNGFGSYVIIISPNGLTGTSFNFDLIRVDSDFALKTTLGDPDQKRNLVYLRQK